MHREMPAVYHCGQRPESHSGQATVGWLKESLIVRTCFPPLGAEKGVSVLALAGQERGQGL